MEHRNYRSQVAILVVLLGVCPPAQSGPPLKGELIAVEGVRVLRLWGEPYERGYAHGHLLAGEIVGMLDQILSDAGVVRDAVVYETLIVGQMLRQFEMEGDRLSELEGMMAGIRAALGPERIRLKKLNRDISVQDLQVVNTLADWSQFFCSSVSAWGQLTENGEMLTARNLDFAPLPGLRESPVVLAFVEPGAGRKPWVSIAWPTLIGAYTAMNADGVTISIHDVYGSALPEAGRFVPRSFALREAIETAAAGSAVEDVEKILRGRAVLCGNNIHVSAPHPGSAIPAAVLEWGGSLAGAAPGTNATERVSRRTADASGTWVACTNHYRLRAPASACSRYAAIETALTEWASHSRKIDFDAAWKLLGAVEQRQARALTLQSVVFLPNQKEMLVSLANPSATPSQVKPVRLRLRELLARP